MLQALADSGAVSSGLSLSDFANWCASSQPDKANRAVYPWLTPSVCSAILGLQGLPFSDLVRFLAERSDEAGLFTRETYDTLWSALTPAALDRAFGPQRAQVTAFLFTLLADSKTETVDFLVLAASLSPLCSESTPRRLATLWQLFDTRSFGGLNRAQLQELLAGILRSHALFDPDARGSLAAAALVAGVAPMAVTTALDAWASDDEDEGSSVERGGGASTVLASGLALARIASQLARGLAAAAFAASAAPRATELPLVAFLTWLLDVRLPILDISSGTPAEGGAAVPPPGGATRSRSAPGYGRRAAKLAAAVPVSAPGAQLDASADRRPQAEIPAPFRGATEVTASPAAAALRVKRERSWADTSISDEPDEAAGRGAAEKASHHHGAAVGAGVGDSGSSSPVAVQPLRKRLETDRARGASAHRDEPVAADAAALVDTTESADAYRARPVLLPQFSRPVFDPAIGARTGSAKKQGPAAVGSAGGGPGPRSRSAPGNRAFSRSASPGGGGRVAAAPLPSAASPPVPPQPPANAAPPDATAVIEVVRALAELPSAPAERVVLLFSARADVILKVGCRPTALSSSAFAQAYAALLAQQVRAR